MDFKSETSGRIYEVTEAVEPKVMKKNETTDILVIFDWESGEKPVIVNYLFGASFLEESKKDIQRIITKYEIENNLIKKKDDINHKYEISVYNNDNDLRNHYVVEADTESELEVKKEQILEKHYRKDKEAKYCTIDKVVTHSNALFKENFGY